MSKARQQRLKEARKWFPEQGFTEDSHIVKAYRKKFNVDRTCAMKELCLLHVLSPEKQASYEAQLKAKKEKRQRRKQQVEFQPFDQDEYFYFIAGYTSGGAPYGITWEQAREDGLLDPPDERDHDDWDLPFD
ncbi:hypothetical protein [Butyrivibrio sp. AE3006]|jgi:hypothetical protein|uniref:hypothetical protein n=1 Tax=Butyrivibrio sp. AE3006 TaxID=1280673 RepID=UPI000402AFA3|nr:hypothetical protein [Butyrivibrio sp. AE3006]